MTNKTKLNDEFILTVKKEIQLSGQSITKYLTYSIFSIIAAVVLFCVYRSTNEILGIILPIIMISLVSLNILIQGSKGHAFHACMKKHDLLTRKTPKSSHFS